MDQAFPGPPGDRDRALPGAGSGGGWSGPAWPRIPVKRGVPLGKSWLLAFNTRE